MDIGPYLVAVGELLDDVVGALLGQLVGLIGAEQRRRVLTASRDV